MSFSDWAKKSYNQNLQTGNTKEIKMTQNQKLVAEQQAQQQQGPGAMPSFEYDRHFIGWLASIGCSFLISSYKTHQVFSIGVVNDPRDGQNKMSLWLTKFNRPMGIHASAKSIWVSSSGNLWRYDNSGKIKDVENNKAFSTPDKPIDFGFYDANFIPRMAYYSNDIDAHDVCVDSDDNPYYCSALFSCICQPSIDHSFKVYWKPPWIDKIAPEDRCHLNGLCARDGKPRYVTTVCKSNVRGAWRQNRIEKGIVYDIVEEELVCSGLTMPHSPRWHNDKLWVLDAGTGYFGYVDMDNKEFVKKVFIPGYLRGLTFIGNEFAIVGSSEDRHEGCFKGLPLGDRLEKEGIKSECGMFVVDLNTFDIIHHLTFKSPTNELYDICVLPGIRRPRLTEINDESNMRLYKIDYNGHE